MSDLKERLITMLEDMKQDQKITENVPNADRSGLGIDYSLRRYITRLEILLEESE